MINKNNQKMKPVKKKTPLVVAISMALAIPNLEAATFNVTEQEDDGTGLIANTLSWAIFQANTNEGDDVIELNTDVSITGVMKRLIDSNITIQSDATHRTISGNNQFRPLFIKSGQVTIQDLNIENGLAQGGEPGGAGLGGGIFIYDGSVQLNEVSISDSSANGVTSFQISEQGGGGMFGDSIFPSNPYLTRTGGGGLFASTSTNAGAYGGYGLYNNSDAMFGRGGDLSQPGGFGGGGGGTDSSVIGGDGGFGGGGGYCSCDYSGYQRPGFGGFGASSGRGGFGYFLDSLGGRDHYSYGATFSGSAGMGGAVFVRSGQLNLTRVNFFNNQALGFDSAKGLGGALFVIHTLNNSNGNNQGMPSVLPTITACEVTLMNNFASDDTDSENNNDDVFDMAARINQNTSEPIGSMCDDDLIFFNGFD